MYIAASISLTSKNYITQIIITISLTLIIYLQSFVVLSNRFVKKLIASNEYIFFKIQNECILELFK